ncbi:MAG: hypothetical protein P1P90_00765 [Patescibacteria group bacterium]|nr:hypothetical protein [Patescibacteria group bacterium]
MPPRKTNLKKAKNRKALYDYMTPAFWRAHFAVPAGIFFISLGIALGIAHSTTLQPYSATATTADNIVGWAWTTHVGWFSLNDINAGACGTPPCGSYGINIDPATSTQPHWNPSMWSVGSHSSPPDAPDATVIGHAINGFVWSDNVGFICFGNSCNIPACTGTFYPDPPGGEFYAYAEQITGTNTVEVHGWAVICNQKDAGWISLNCNDLGACDGSAGSTYYKLVYNPVTQTFHNAANTGSPFAWNGNTDGSGIGYINFYMSALGMHLDPDPEVCTDNIDNNLNGATDCSDSACVGTPACPEICDNGIDDDADTLVDCADPDCACTESICNDGVDNDFDGPIDCADTDCSANPVCMPETICDDSVDNDSDGDVDCADSDCAGDPVCVPPQPQCTDFPAGPNQADQCCNDLSDNGTGFVDCYDSDCRSLASVCSAWLQVSTGNIYANLGITGTKPSDQTGLSNTKWCLRSDQTIDWTSEESCKQEGVGNIELPSTETNYRNKLGFLDLAGMRVNNRYAPVKNIANAAGIPNTLNGTIYHYTGSGEFVLPAKTFANGLGTTGNGSGLLLIEGADLRIIDNIDYSATAVQSRLKNLASFGVVVVKNAFGAGGNIYIDPNVTKISGVYFAESNIYTGTTGSPPDDYLDMVGIFIANQFNLQRDNNTDPARPAERILFDGRAVVNPPPGLSDMSKSLPRATEVSF